MSEATAIHHPPDVTSMRRWERYRVNVPIRVIVSHAMKASIFDGRGTSLSEGGMALFAGAELRPGDQVAVEFTPPFSSPPIQGGRQNLQSNRIPLRGGVSGCRQCPKRKRGLLRQHLASFTFVRPEVRFSRSGISASGCRMACRFCAEAAKSFQSLRGGFNQLLFGLEDRAAFLFREHADGFSHPPVRECQASADHRPMARAGHAVVTHHADAFGKAVESLEFKSGQIDTLQLFGGIGHENAAGFWLLLLELLLSAAQINCSG